MLLISFLVLEFNIQSTINTASSSQVESDGVLALTFNFPHPIVARVGSYDSVTMPGLPQYGAPGEPVLPFRIVRALLPQGKTVQSIDVSPSNKEMVEGQFSVAYGETPLPLSSNITVVDRPDEKIYASTDSFPSALFSHVSGQLMRGYKILDVRLHPIQYVPATGILQYFKTMTVTITLKETRDVSPMFRNFSQDRELAAGIVDNAGEAETYIKTPVRTLGISPVDSSYSYDYVVITNNALKSSFQQLVDWKVDKGLNATIVLVEDIMSDPDYHCDGLFGDGYGTPKFNDTQAHIRNFIKDAYQNWGVDYVLLGGDDEIIPDRGVYCYAGIYTDYNIPCDMYYGALDGSWDKDNDTIFGETLYHWPGPENGTAGEEADFFAEVYIGRAPVDTAQEAANFVTKTLAYEQASQAEYLKKALMIGQKLDDITQGGNVKDTITEIIPQYTTTRLYSRDGTFSATAVINAMNSGVHIVNHDGHANYATVMGLSRPQVDSLVNTEYFMAYSTGCNSAAFDEETSGSDESIGEHFVFSSHGAFAYIGNSRYGWYCSASTDAPGDRYDRLFFSLLNDGFRNLGKALQLSKQLEPILDRWICFTLNLLGDPETEIVTAIKTPTAHFETRTDLLAPPRIGGVVDLRGTARRGTAIGATFSNFTIQFGLGTNPSSWSTTGISLVNNGQNEISNSTLGTWNTTQLTDNPYTLRLIVSDADGLVDEDRKVVFVIQDAISIHIKSDGSVSPSTAPIQRNGDLYVLTGDITNTGDGIMIERDNMTLEGAGHTVQGGVGAGIRLYGRSNVTIENVSINGRSYGIYLEQSSNNIVSGCYVASNIHGIFLLKSSYNKLISNNVTSNYCGISLLSFSNNNSIIRNRITENIGTYAAGIYIFLSSNNYVYHNILLDNSLHIYDAMWDCADPDFSSPNVWDSGYPSGGNYWSGYAGLDENCGPNQNYPGSDGMGDEPYVIDLNNKDRYPLMNPWTPPAGHDVAIISLVPSKTAVGQGYFCNINVYVANKGEYAETFHVITYANATSIETQIVALEGGEFATLTVTWNTTGVAKGNYTVWAYAWPVQGETDTDDNTCVGGVIKVVIPGDVNADGIVETKDVAAICRLYGKTPTDPSWNPNLDINDDNIIETKDVAIACRNYGKTDP